MSSIILDRGNANGGVGGAHDDDDDGSQHGTKVEQHKDLTHIRYAVR